VNAHYLARWQTRLGDLAAVKSDTPGDRRMQHGMSEIRPATAHIPRPRRSAVERGNRSHGSVLVPGHTWGCRQGAANLGIYL